MVNYYKKDTFLAGSLANDIRLLSLDWTLPIIFTLSVSMALFRYSKSLVFQARGGPIVEVPSQQVTRTRAGRYVVAVIAKHKSSSRWAWSTIEWGTPLRDAKGIIQVEQNGRWINLSSFKAFESFKKDEPALLKLIADRYADFKRPLFFTAHALRSVRKKFRHRGYLMTSAIFQLNTLKTRTQIINWIGVSR